MAYANATLLTVLKKIERHQICLPSIQRKFEWGMDRIEMLFDSILNDYPIGTFLIWNVADETILKYKFFEINNQFNLNLGKWQRARTSETTNDELWALLDGQQRLTSISIGLQGSYTYKKNNKLVTKFLYFNILPYNNSENYATFKFFEQGIEKKDPDNFWIPASMIIKTLDKFHSEDTPLNLNYYESIKQIIQESIENKNNNLKVLFSNWNTEYVKIGNQVNKFGRKIARIENFSYYLINHTVDLDICNEIFVRINSGGVKLSKADLLFSTVVSSWEQGRTHVDNLIKSIDNTGYQVDTEFIIRTCLYLVNSDILFKINSFNDQTVTKIIDNFWKDNDENSIYSSTIKTFEFLKNKLRIPDKILKSKNVLIPVIHHHFHGGTLGDDSIFEVQKFIYISLLQKIFGSHGDTLLKDLRKGVTNDDGKFKLIGKCFSFNDVISKITEDAKKRLYVLDQKSVENFLEIEKGNDSWLVLSLIYRNLPYEYQSYDQDHLHPVSLFKKKTYSKDLIKAKELYNKIPNLAFSTPDENRLNKNAHPLKEYIENILKSKKPDWYSQYKSFNKIDETVSLEIDDFENFFDKRREKLLETLLNELCLSNDVDFNNSIVDENDYPDIDEANQEVGENDEPTEMTIKTINYQDNLNNINNEVINNYSSHPLGFSIEHNLICNDLYKELISVKFNFIYGINKVDEIYHQVYSKFPHLCDNSYLCEHNCMNGSKKQPEWKHRVRSALSAMKEKGIIEYDEDNNEYTFS